MPYEIKFCITIVFVQWNVQAFNIRTVIYLQFKFLLGKSQLIYDSPSYFCYIFAQKCRDLKKRIINSKTFQVLYVLSTQRNDSTRSRIRTARRCSTRPRSSTAVAAAPPTTHATCHSRSSAAANSASNTVTTANTTKRLRLATYSSACSTPLASRRTRSSTARVACPRSSAKRRGLR